MSVREDLLGAIAALESQRLALGDAVVDAALAPLKARLSEIDTGAAAQIVQQELKQVTVLFADTVGSTALGQRLDPEDLTAILDGALAGLAKIVVESRGQVMSYTGDGLLAAFGADESQENDPELAVRAGLAMLDYAKVHAADTAKRFGVSGYSIRIGVHTGPVLLGGTIATANAIRGDTVNIAARLEQAAPPGGLRISHDTYRHVRGVFDVTQEPALKLKGVAEPVRTYLVLRAKPRAFRVASRGVEGIETPMVGREREFATLRNAFLELHHNVDAAERTAAITVVADAGVGKSRLLYEFENWAEERPERFILFKGRALPSTQQQPFGLLRDVFAWRLQISDSDDVDLARAKLCSQLAPLFPGDGEGELHLLGHLIGLDFSASPHVAPLLGDPKQIRRSGLQAAATVFRRLGAGRGAPAVLLLDDLHWADDGSLDFFQSLLTTDRASPLLVASFARPELDDRRANWPGGDTGHTRVTMKALDPASRADLADILLKRLDTVPDALRRMLAAGGDGNPFFMEELVKMLIDDGAIVVQSETWRVSSDKLLAAKVPSTLTGVLQARLDGLSSDERVALQAASVIGYVFWNRALDAIAPDAASALTSLAKRELVIRQRASAIEGAQEYTFKHHVLQQVVYESILKSAKLQLHARAGAWFAALSETRSGEYSGVTASHYERAGDNEAAVKHFMTAAETAAGRDAGDAVLDYATRALALCDTRDLRSRWRLIAIRERALAYSEDRAGHAADLDALEALAEALDEDGLRAEVLFRRACAYTNTGDFPEAEAAAKRARAIAQRARASSLAVQAFGVEATACRRMSKYQRARDLAERGLALAREGENLAVQADLCRSLAAIYAESGHPAEDQEYRLEALELFRRLGDRGNISHMLNNVGDGLVRIGDYTGALRCFEEALQIARKIGRRDNEALVLLNMAAIAVLQGDHPNARALASDARAIAAVVGARDLEAAASLPLGLAELALGATAQARHHLQHSRDLFLKNSGHHYALEPIVALAVTALAENDLATAMAHLEPALEHLDGGFAGAEEPLRMRLMCYQVLAAADDPRSAPVLSGAFAELQDRAQRIADPVMRRRYLEEVPHHAAIVAAWNRLKSE